MNDSQSDPLSRQEFSLNTLVHSDCSLLCKAVNFCYPRAVWPHREKKEWVKKKKCYRILIKVGPYAHKSHGGYLLVPGRLAGRRRVPNQIGLYEKSYCIYCHLLLLFPRVRSWKEPKERDELDLCPFGMSIGRSQRSVNLESKF